MRQGPTRPPPIGYGCLAVAIIAAVVAGLLAVVFAWDVNQPG